MLDYRTHIFRLIISTHVYLFVGYLKNLSQYLFFSDLAFKKCIAIQGEINKSPGGWESFLRETRSQFCQHFREHQPLSLLGKHHNQKCKTELIAPPPPHYDSLILKKSSQPAQYCQHLISDLQGSKISLHRVWLLNVLFIVQL